MVTRALTKYRGLWGFFGGQTSYSKYFQAGCSISNTPTIHTHNTHTHTHTETGQWCGLGAQCGILAREAGIAARKSF